MLEPRLAGDCLRQSEAEAATCLDDDQLIAFAKTEPRFFGDLYDRYYSRILNYIYRRTLDVPLAEELTSNTFFKALRALPNYTHRGKFGAWLYRIAGNEIRLHWRAWRRRRDANASWREDFARVRFAADAETTSEDFVEQARQFARLHDAVSQLPERYQAALSLRYFEGLTNEEVADVLEKKPTTVKSLIHRGLKRLRGRLEAGGAANVQDRHSQVPEEYER